MNPQTDKDNLTVFDRLWHILEELRQKVGDRFDLHPNPTTQPLQTFSSPDGKVQGSLATFSSAEIDWLVHSRLNNPTLNFSTMRLTVWLGSQIQVPHLAFEFGTVPNLFFYIDYIPRVDLWSDLNYLERYYEPLQSTYLTLRGNSDLSLFVSKSLYVRQIQSPTHLCYTCSPTEESLALIQRLAHEMLERWFKWVDDAEPVPETMQPILAQRDRCMRRISAERDPGNQMAAQLFGAELTNTLVRGLWGGDRFVQ